MNFARIIKALEEYCRTNNYSGYDPYDGLNSRFIKIFTLKNKYLRIIATQFVRRFPFNIRPLFGIQKGENPKGIGLFLWSYTKLFKVKPKEEYRQQVDYLFTRLEALASKGYSGACWGYNFDWQSRTFFRPQGTPTIVNSSFIGHALLDAYETFKDEKFLKMALSIRQFLLNDLHRTKLDDDSFCFSYTPVDTGVVHNANMMGASLLIRLYKYCKEEEVKKAALASLSFSMKHQRKDGSWYYADTFSERWIDSFHTGFNLQAIQYFFDEGYALEYKESFKLGVDYYAQNFFLEDGTPKYYHDKTYPVDIHAPAQAIVFFAHYPEYAELVTRILNWTVENMFDEEGGFFYFRKTPRSTNKISYMRWTQSWALHALSSYNLSIAKKEITNERN